MTFVVILPGTPTILGVVNSGLVVVRRSSGDDTHRSPQAGQRRLAQWLGRSQQLLPPPPCRVIVARRQGQETKAAAVLGAIAALGWPVNYIDVTASITTVEEAVQAYLKLNRNTTS